MNFIKLASVFKNTQNSYKYYWWFVITEICFEEQKNELNFNEIVLKIISKIWCPVNYFKLSFGIIDQCSKYVKQIQLEYRLEENISEKDLYQFLVKHKNSDFLKNITKELTRYVPYRFIRPWYSEETRDLKDSKVNSKILDLQNQKAPYIIDYKLKKIIVSKYWFEWINKNYILIKAFTMFELIKYLEKENPNVVNLSKKLEKPTSRNLSTQTKYWKRFILKKPNQNDIFENKPFLKIEKISLDHFFPWSYFSHDLIWNLHPIDKHINSSKNNLLPSKKYFEPFFLLQYDFSKFLLREDKRHLLVDYFSLFKCSREELAKMPKEIFKENMSKHYLPQHELAKNMGFQYGWVL